MNFFFNMLNLQIMLFLLIGIGILSKKIGIINNNTRKTLSDLLINIILPCNIIQSFLGDISITKDFLINCVIAVILSFIIQISATFIGQVIFKKFPKRIGNIMSYALICSNSSFIGLPVAECLYGNIGVLYTSLFQIPIRFTMWTAGLSLFTNVNKKDAFKKLIQHPCIISIFIGFLLMILPLELPICIGNTISAVSKCNVPISMFVIGAILADADIHSIFSKPVIYFSILRLIIFPLLIFAILKPFALDPLLVSISVIMTGMPAGSTTSILAEKYGCDSIFASKIIFVSTLFSIVTIPILSLII